MKQNRKREIVTLAVVCLGVLLVSALAVYFIGNSRTPEYTQVQQPGQVEREPGLRPTPTPADNETLLDRLMGTRSSDTYVRGERWIQTMGRIGLRLLLATLLGAALAYRPRRRILAIKRNPYVAQTQILLAIVAAALMIIVGDNAARAFGIFAAVSLVRFRTNIRDPKEITVLLISLALGLSAGVGRWELGISLCLFVLALLWLLEHNEPEKLFRAMELTVKTRDTDRTQDTLKRIFDKFRLEAEVRQLN